MRKLTDRKNRQRTLNRFISKAHEYLDMDELMPVVLNDMVNAVYVHMPDTLNGHREQQIDISYDLVGSPC